MYILGAGLADAPIAIEQLHKLMLTDNAYFSDTRHLASFLESVQFADEENDGGICLHTHAQAMARLRASVRMRW